jgi:hypothetical protein
VAAAFGGTVRSRRCRGVCDQRASVAKERFAVQLSDTVANFWPTRSQELLLRACLLRGDEALEAWREWEKLFGEGEVGAAERRLLPLLYRNLRDHDVRGPLVGRLKEEYSHAWSQNQFSFHGAAELVAWASRRYS